MAKKYHDGLVSNFKDFFESSEHMQSRTLERIFYSSNSDSLTYHGKFSKFCRYDLIEALKDRFINFKSDTRFIFINYINYMDIFNWDINERIRQYLESRMSNVISFQEYNFIVFPDGYSEFIEPNCIYLVKNKAGIGSSTRWLINPLSTYPTDFFCSKEQYKDYVADPCWHSSLEQY